MEEFVDLTPAPPPANTRLFSDHLGIIRWDVANMAALRRECESACTENVRARAHASFKGAVVNARVRPTSLPPSLPRSPRRLLLPAVPRRSPAKLGGRCCPAKLPLKCLPCSPVSPTTQSTRIRSLYLCLGQVRRRSCVHPPSTFGVEGPPAPNVRPLKKKKQFRSHFLSLFCICPAAGRGGRGREVSRGLQG